MDRSPLPPWLWRGLPPWWREPLSLVARAVVRWSDDRGPQLGAAIAFYTMFAVAPLLVVAIAIASAVFGEQAARGQIVSQIAGVVGLEAARSIEVMIESAWRHPNGLWASILGVATLLVGATGVFAELRRALNAIAHVPPPTASALSAFVRARLMGFALVLGFGFLAIVTLLLSAVLAALGAYLSRHFAVLAELLGLADVLVSTGVLTVAFAALLRWLPDRPPTRRGMWVGALSSAVLFSVGKHLIGLYLVHASVASSYGAAGSFVVLMLWVYYSAQILLLGGALGAVVDEQQQRPAAGGGAHRLPA